MRCYIKLPLITIGSILLLYGGFIFYIWITNPAIQFGNPLYMDYRYQRLFTLPLANSGCPKAQYKMGAYWFYGGVGALDETLIPKEELTKAIEWWEKAAANGHKKAIEDLAKAKKLLLKANKKNLSN